MTTDKLRRLLPHLGPGLFLALLITIWALFSTHPGGFTRQWWMQWSEPQQPTGVFKIWRQEGNRLVGETEIWPHKHSKANGYLLSKKDYEGRVEVELRVRFRLGRYLGCYLCYDPEVGNGYWLATGHAVGEHPGKAYIKILRKHEWQTMARAPLSIQPNREYHILFRRKDQKLSVIVDGKPIVNWSNPDFTRGRVQLRLHNTKIEIIDLTVHGDPIR